MHPLWMPISSWIPTSWERRHLPSCRHLPSLVSPSPQEDSLPSQTCQCSYRPLVIIDEAFYLAVLRNCPFPLPIWTLAKVPQLESSRVKIQAPNRVYLAHSLVVGCLQPHFLPFQYPWDRRVEGTIPRNTWKQQLPLVVKRKTSLMKLRRINCQIVLRNPLIQSDITDGATKMQRTEGTRPTPRS